MTSEIVIQAKSSLPTRYGLYELILYQESKRRDHICLIMGEINIEDEVLVRLHSKCTTGDALGSLRCDCQAQLNLSMQKIQQEGKGVIIYLDQEGRDIGLVEKIKAYHLQDTKGLNTVDANLALGHPVDGRNYEVACQILKELGVHHVRLLTNNPLKVKALEEFSFKVTREALEIPPNPYSKTYLETKLKILGHDNGFLQENEE